MGVRSTLLYPALRSGGPGEGTRERTFLEQPVDGTPLRDEAIDDI